MLWYEYKRVTKCGNNFAVSSDGLATALQDSASALMSAGNNLEQSVALVAAANKVLQDPSQVGSALRTIALRIRGTSVEVLEEMGEETDGVIESVSKLQEKVKGLTGVDILTDSGAYKETYEIIKELAEVWPTLDDMDQAAALEMLAGKNRSNALAAILTNLDDLTGAYEDAMKAQGSAEAENEKYMNSIQGKIDLFNNALQTMWMGWIDSGFVKSIVEAGTAVVELANKLGLIPSILAVIAGYNLGKIFVPQIITAFSTALKANIATITGETVAIEALNAAKVREKIVNAANIGDDAKQIALKTLLTTALGKETIATDLKTVADIKAALMQKGLNAAEAEGVIAAMGLTGANSVLGASFGTLTASIGATTKALLTMLFTTPVGWAILAAGAIVGVVSAYNGLKQVELEAAESAQQSAQALQEKNSSLDSYKEKIESLRKSLDDGNLSEEEAYNARKQLMSIQDELIAKFGDEAKGINLVTGAIEDQVAALDKLKAANANAWLDENSERTGFLGLGKSAIDQAINAMEDTQDTYLGLGTNIWNKAFKEAYGDDTEEYFEKNKKAALEYQKFVESLGGTLELDSNTIRFTNVTKEQIKDYYEQITNYLRQLEAQSGGKLDLGDMIGKISADKTNKIGEDFETHKANYEAYLENTAIAKYTDSYGKILDAQEKFNEEYAKGNTEGAKAARAELEAAINEAVAQAGEGSRQAKWFEGLDDDFVAIFKDMDFTDAWDAAGSQLKSSIEQTLKDASFDEDIDILGLKQYFDDVGNLIVDQNVAGLTNQQVAGYQALVAKANEYGMSIDELVAKLSQLGAIQGDTFAKTTSFDITDYTESIGTLNDQISAYQDALNKLNDGSFTMGDYVELIEEFPDLAKGVDVSSKSFNGLTKNLRKAINSKPKELIKSLQELKKSLKTKEEKKQVEELIKALKELGKIKFDSLEDELFSLEQALQKASELGNALENAMDLNPNKNYDTVKDALGEIQGLLDVGKIGSYSPIWDMIEALAGPEAATALRNAENIGQAVQDWINVRRGYYPEEEGFDSQQAAVKFFQDFIGFTDQAVKAAAAAGDEAAQKFADAFTFDENGDMKLDLPNESWDEYLDFLNQYSDGFKALNMSAGEFAALMMNMGQYNPNLDLQDFRDLKDFLDSILESEDSENILSGLDNVLASINKRLEDNGKEPIDWDNILNSEDLAAQRAKIEEALKSLNIDPKIISNLMDSIANAFKFKDRDLIAQAQTKIQSLINEVNNLLEGENLEPIDWDKILEADGVDAQMKLIEDALNKLSLDPSKLQEYVDAFRDYLNQIDALKNAQNVLEDDQNRYIQKAGEATEATEQTTEAVKELKNVIVTTTTDDPLGITSLMNDIASLEGYLTALGIEFKSFTDITGNTTLTLNTDDLIRKLDEAGLTTDEISKKLAYLENQEGIKLDVDASELTPEKIQEKIDASTEGKDIELKVDADIVQASTKLQELQAQIDTLRQLVSANPISLDIDMGDTSWNDLLKLGSAKLFGEGEDASATLDSLETLLEKLNEIKTAIDVKTEAFRTEGTEIPPLIQAEVEALENLRAKLAEIVGNDNDASIVQELNDLIALDIDDLAQSLQNAAEALAEFQAAAANNPEIYLNLTGNAFDLNKLQTLQNKVNNIYTRFNLIKGLNPIGLDVTINYGKAMTAAREINDIIQELKDLSPVKIDVELPEDLELEELEEKNLKFNIDTSQLDAAISAYDSLQNKTVTVTLAQNPTDIISVLQSMKAAIDALSDKTYTITEIFRRIIITTTISRGGGGAGVNGTAHVQGTAHASGTAHKGGDWGIKKDETALVGELGEELVVRGNKWFTVGDNGAEFTSLQKGDIVFNHKQTQDLLSKGYVAGRGRAVAQGTAHAEGTAYASGSGWNGSYQGSHSGGGDDEDSDDYEEVIDWFEILLEEINEQLDLMNAKLENAVGISAKKSLIGQILSVNHDELGKLNEGLKLYTDYAAKLLNNVPEQYRDAVQNGAVDITEFFGEANKDTVEAINKYRDWAKKIADVQQQLEEVKTTISDLRVDALDMINTEYENTISLITIVNDKIEDTIDLLEEQGERVSANYYEEMIKNSEDQLRKLQEQRAAMQAEFNEAVASGDVQKYSENWYDMLNSIYDVDEAIIDCKTDIEGFNNAILDLHWENFEKIVTALDAISDEAEQIRSVIKDSEITDEVGNWTKLGMTALGMASQEMEKAKYRIDLYGEQIEELNKQFAAGKYSQDEYREKLQELKEAQWDSIDAYESAKDTIVELNRTRVEAVKDGIQKEIDAYEELINKRKEDLDAQKD